MLRVNYEKAPDAVNDLFDKYNTEEGATKRYIATSPYEFGVLLHRALMFPVSTERVAHHVERHMYKLTPYRTLIYKDIVWSENLGLVIGFKRVAKPVDMHKDYDLVMGMLSMHFETLDGTLLSEVGVIPLCKQILSIIGHKDYTHKEASYKALTKFIDNQPDFNIEIENVEKDLVVVDKA